MASDDSDLATLHSGAVTLGIPLNEDQQRTFSCYRTLLLDWNKRINLTAITDPAEILTHHFLDSLTCALPLSPAQRRAPLFLIDIGSGAGFPGLPLAIAFPTWQVCLLEATGKKVHFLAAAIEALGLTNVSPLYGRAEEVAHLPRYRGSFDIATARAVASLPTLLEYCAPFVKPGGLMLLPKKGDLGEELAWGKRAAPQLGAFLGKVQPLPLLAGLDSGRVIVTARQQRPCPVQYPRAAGAPRKRPLH
ncbi:MAG: 16S rRNA (guanine(527)-N(7))-methyltransferase RsmG [Chloroflexi bacterium]|nr:MAG: 16S rRNA (guanine(527)-N(7))-methyltransferase RsmG [Chloroflexota bacterium]